MNSIIVVGRLTKEVELRYIPTSGTAVATFTVAVGRGIKGQDDKEETDFIVCRAWGKVAENCANYLVKGSQVAVLGSLRIDKYDDKDGVKKSFTYVNSTRVQFLDRKKDKDNSFNPTGLDPQGFSAIDDQDIPF